MRVESPQDNARERDVTPGARYVRACLTVTAVQPVEALDDWLSFQRSKKVCVDLCAVWTTRAAKADAFWSRACCARV